MIINYTDFFMFLKSKVLDQLRSGISLYDNDVIFASLLKSSLGSVLETNIHMDDFERSSDN